MALTRTRAVRLSDPSGAAEARRTASALARECGFDGQDVGRIALVVTELCTNVVKHAGGGVAAVNAVRSPKGPVLQVLTTDTGPGFDVRACLRDGHSTTGTGGGGLGAVSRMSDAFDVYSVAGQGSVLLAEVRDRRPTSARAPTLFRLGSISVPVEGEQECGDAWSGSWFDDLTLVFVADGIGHGVDAAEAARTAVRAFEDAGTREPKAIIEQVHAALRPTRGATVAVAAIDAPHRGTYVLPASATSAPPLSPLVPYGTWCRTTGRPATKCGRSRSSSMRGPTRACS